MSVERSPSATAILFAATLLAVLAGCDEPQIIDGRAASYCEAKGFVRGTDANARCALQRQDELAAAGTATPAQNATPTGLIGTLPSPDQPSAASQTVPATVIQGQTAMVSFSFGPNCDAAGLPTVSIETPPKHGTVRVVRRSDDPRLSRIVVPVACGKLRVPGVAVDYTAPRDYEGEDSLEIAEVSAAGVRTVLKVPLTVEKPPPLDDIDP